MARDYARFVLVTTGSLAKISIKNNRFRVGTVVSFPFMAVARSG